MKTVPFSLLMTASAVETSNLQTVQDNYARFGQGDIPGILATLSDDIEWVHGGDSVIPYSGTYRGIPEVVRFFETLGQNAQITVFQPGNFRQEGNQIINDCHIEGTALPTGKTSSDDSVMISDFDEDGRLIRWEAAGDFENLAAAFR